MRVRIVPAPLRPAALSTAGLAILFTLMATPALAQGPGLPRGYDIQRIDSPSPFQSGTFGTQTIPIGDVNNDGEEDIGTNQTNGTPQGCVPGPPSTCNNEGQVWVYSGESGGLLGTFTAPDLGNPANEAGNNRALVDRWMDRLGDIGSCPANTAAGQTCASAAVGPPDGHADFFLGAEGVDVGGVRDIGRVYVIDGRTLSVLKRIDMPPTDRQLVVDRRLQFAGTTIVAGFGRTAITPRGLPVCAGNAGVTPCPPTSEIPQNVRTGDIDGGGHPEIVIGANFFPEIPQTAHPNSHCAQAPANTICHQAGRAYIYRGEDVAGSNPAVVLDGSGPGQTPAKVIRNMAAQADIGDQAAFVRAEAFGHAVMPVGDVGTCRSGTAGFPVVAPGERCTVAARTNAPDGKPDVIISAHLADGPAFNPDPSRFNEGVSFVVDGATGAFLHTIHHPEPQPSAFFGYTTRQTFPFGQLFGTALPDYVQASWQNYAGKPAAGRLYVLNGDFNNPFALIATVNDPTPTSNARFGVAREGVGNLVPTEPGVEALVGNFPANENFPDAITDVHFMNLLNGKSLQRIDDPDQQPSSSFGYQVTPLGDLNEDGFLDFAASSPSWDSPAVGAVAGRSNQGRIYIYRSDNTAPPPTGGGRGGGGGGGGTPTRPAGPLQAFTDCPASAANVIRGSAAGGSITGTPRGDRIFGGTGNDIVDALAGDDCVDLGTGDDRGQGGLGNDLLIGGLGGDRVAGSDGNDRLRGNPGNDRLEGGRGNDNVAGDSGNDTLLGLFGNDRLHGVSGRDVISGSRGQDRINGGAGNDRISGGSSGDRIAGDAGSDRINGNSGRDRITGNSGNDRITSRDSSRDRVNCGRGRDRVLADRRDIVSGNCERVSRRR